MVVNRGLARHDRQDFLPWMVAPDGRFCHFGIRGPSLDRHHTEVQAVLWKPSTCESTFQSQLITYGTADLISMPAWRYTIEDAFNFGSF